MRGGRGFGWRLGLALLLGVVALGAAPASPTYRDLQRAIAQIREALPTRPPRDRTVWETFCKGLESELTRFQQAANEADRKRALDRLQKYRDSVQGVSWDRGVQARDRLDAWLQPRLTVAESSGRLLATVRRVSSDPDSTARHERWIKLIEGRLGTALREYEGADTVRRRVAALDEIQAVREILRVGNQAQVWEPSRAVLRALEDLCVGPNLDAAADATSLSVLLAKDVVESGPIAYRGQTSQIIAGPRTGFDLLTCDGGIAFSNSQQATTITPIQGFQDQIAADARGRKAAHLYEFGATSRDDSQITIVAVLTTDGVQLRPSATHHLSAAVRSSPIREPGLGLTRDFASFVGMDQHAISEQVKDGLMAQLRREVPARAAEISRQKAGAVAAQINTQLRPFLPGDGTIRTPSLPVNSLLSVGPLELADPWLQSRPDRAFAGGTLGWHGADHQRGADLPPPSHFHAGEPGAVIHIHLPSLFANLARGFFQTPEVRAVHELMIVAGHKPPQEHPGGPIQTVMNPEDHAFREAVDALRGAEDSGAIAVRIRRPKQAPDFAIDAEGRLVVLVHDLQVDVPAPEPKGLAQLFRSATPPPKIYRISTPVLEVAVRVEFTHGTGQQAPRFVGRIDMVDLGSDVTVSGIGAHPEDVQPTNTVVKTGALAVFASRLNGKDFALPLENLDAPAGFVLRSISPFDPSGWVRVVLRRD